MMKPTDQIPMRAIHGERRFRIEFGGGGIGYYLYVYNGDRCTHDYLQDTLDLARECAFEMFGVPRESWTHEHETA